MPRRRANVRRAALPRRGRAALVPSTPRPAAPAAKRRPRHEGQEPDRHEDQQPPVERGRMLGQRHTDHDRRGDQGQAERDREEYVREDGPHGCRRAPHRLSLARGARRNHPRSREAVPSAGGGPAAVQRGPWNHDELDHDDSPRGAGAGRGRGPACPAHRLRGVHGAGMGGAVLLLPRLLVPRRLPREPR